MSFVITKVATTDVSGENVEIALTDDHGNVYSGSFAVEFSGASGELISLIPEGFVFSDSTTIKIPLQAPIASVRFGDGSETPLSQIELVGLDFQPDYSGDALTEFGTTISLGQYINLVVKNPIGTLVGWDVPVTFENSEYNPIQVNGTISIQFSDGSVHWSASNQVLVPGSGSLSHDFQFLTLTDAFERRIPTGLIVYFGSKDAKLNKLGIIPITLEQLPPLPERIAFEGNNGGLYIMNTDGSGKYELKSDWNIKQPAWSPDGITIAYGQSGDIRTMRLDGRFGRTIAKGAGPAWSPDGRKIAFSRARNGLTGVSGGIFTVDLENGNETRLTSGNRDVDPDWSPDGSKIVFSPSSIGFGTSELRVVSVDEGDVTLLAPKGYEPAWSPDGTKLVFAGHAGPYEYPLSTIDSEGSNLRVLVAHGQHPAWSPDGTKLVFSYDPVFVSALAITRGINVMNSDGSEIKNLGPGKSAAWGPALRFSKDGLIPVDAVFPAAIAKQIATPLAQPVATTVPEANTGTYSVKSSSAFDFSNGLGREMKGTLDLTMVEIGTETFRVYSHMQLTAAEGVSFGGYRDENIVTDSTGTRYSAVSFGGDYASIGERQEPRLYRGFVEFAGRPPGNGELLYDTFGLVEPVKFDLSQSFERLEGDRRVLVMTGMCTSTANVNSTGYWISGVEEWLSREFGYRDLPPGNPDDEIIEFSYSPDGWDSQYGEEDTLQGITDAVTNLMEIYGGAYPNATFDIIAHSLGGVVALDAMVRSPFLRSRTNSIITVDSPIRGLIDQQTLLGAVRGELGCGGNVTDLAAEEFLVWGDLNVDSPTIGRIASDSWEDLVVVNMANISDLLIVPPDIAMFPDKGYPDVWDAGGGTEAHSQILVKLSDRTIDLIRRAIEGELVR